MRLVALYTAGWIAWVLTLPPRPAAWVVGVAAVPILLLASRAAFRGQAGTWRAFAKETWHAHVLGLILLGAVAVQTADAHGVTTDGVIYFSQLRSVIFDRDLDVAAEFTYLEQPPRPSHVVPIGPTFVWLPLYLVVAGVHAGARAIGVASTSVEPISLGLTLPYIRAALLSSFAIGALGVALVHHHLRREFTAAVALIATVTLFAATPLVWYMVYEPSMTHAASFGFVALFIVTAARVTRVEMHPRACVLLGALLGFAVLTRPQEALFALFPAAILLFAAAPPAARLRASVRLAAWAFLGIAPFLALQAAHASVLLSREPFAIAGGGGYLDFRNSHWADTLWSSWHGFFSWTPVAYLAFIATVFYVVRNRAWAVAAVVIVLLMAWVNGATTDWSGGWSFGGRRFTGTLPLLAPGIALIVHTLVRKPMVALSIIAAAAIGWTQLLVVQQQRGMLSDDGTLSFARVIQQQAAVATEPPFVYPFAFPANAVFAWRTGLSLDAYDLLAAEPLLPHFDLEMSADVGRYLVDGWSPRVADPFGDLRWIEGDHAELWLPLDVPAGRQVTVAWTARTRTLDPPESATFALLVNGRETFRFTPQSEQSSHFAFVVPPGDDLWVRGFNRIRFERRTGAPPIGIYRVAVRVDP